MYVVFIFICMKNEDTLHLIVPKDGDKDGDNSLYYDEVNPQCLCQLACPDGVKQDAYAPDEQIAHGYEFLFLVEGMEHPSVIYEAIGASASQCAYERGVAVPQSAQLYEEKRQCEIHGSCYPC